MSSSTRARQTLSSSCRSLRAPGRRGLSFAPNPARHGTQRIIIGAHGIMGRQITFVTLEKSVHPFRLDASERRPGPRTMHGEELGMQMIHAIPFKNHTCPSNAFETLIKHSGHLPCGLHQ